MAHYCPDSVVGSVVGNIAVELEELADVWAVAAVLDMAVVEAFEKRDFDMVAVQVEIGCLENYQKSSSPADLAQEGGWSGTVVL